MSDERLERALSVIAEIGADTAVLTSVGTLVNVAGYEATLETGPSPFGGGPASVVLARDGSCTLVASNAEEPDIEATRLDRVLSYPGFSCEHYSQSLYHMYKETLIRAVDAPSGATVAVEAATLPLAMAEALREQYRLVDVGDNLIRERIQKTSDEIAALRQSAALAAVGQRAAREAALSGRTELEAFTEVRQALEAQAGQRLVLDCDLLTGAARTASVMGPPGARQIEDGDPVLCDLAPRYRGYWGDGCTTFCNGVPSEELVELFDVVERALAHADDVLQPGITAGEIDFELRSVLDESGYDAPLHMGHGIGVFEHEYPRIVPAEPARLRQDMVIMLEPYARSTQCGVRLESMYRITASGSEPLSAYDFRL